MAGETLAYIGLGSNVGDRRALIAQAVDAIKDTPGIHTVRLSSLRKTQALELYETDKQTDASYVNAVAEISTSLDVRSLFEVMTKIEVQLGRQRPSRWAPRTIDLDLLLFGSEIVDEPDLKVPHPQMFMRDFVMRPLSELIPEQVLCEGHVTVSDYAKRLHGGNFVRTHHQPQLIAIAGNIGVGKTTLAHRLAENMGGGTLYEPFDSNPFLAKVYEGQHELSLDSQLYFLAGRCEQLSVNKLEPGKIYIADYIFAKETIYADKLLDEIQLDLYNRLYRGLACQVVEPTLVLYLHDSAKGCLDRIHRRGREYEQGVKLAFLEALNEAYDQLLATWKQSPVIRLDVAEFNCLCDDDMNRLAKDLQRYLVKDGDYACC